ncbi:hypothetical protein HUU05_04345 [candidate division KSB1 bacterium]|nr:hypothetical protein [candidate division KSB1 bacterium]
MRIQLLLTDDWELRGDGSGDMRALQFENIRKLIDIYERYGMRGTFMVEVMQQLRHLEFGERHSELKALAWEWEEVVREVYRRGHDVQLHVHPQWLDARYVKGIWQLSRKWSILDFTAAQMRAMLRECKRYLENLLRAEHPTYECVLFRSGAWCAAPNDHLMSLLADIGIRFDLSIVSGLCYDLEAVRLDYREVEEPFLPYYPNMRDARRVADSIAPIVCVPTHSVRPDSHVVLANWMSYLATKFPPAMLPQVGRDNLLAPSAKQTSANGATQNYVKRWRTARSRSLREKIRAYFSSISYRSNPASSLSALSYAQMKNVLRDIRRRAAESGWPVVPIVLANHTKDIGDFKPIEKFCAYLREVHEIEVITSKELLQNFCKGVYPINVRRQARESVALTAR